MSFFIHMGQGGRDSVLAVPLELNQAKVLGALLVEHHQRLEIPL